MGEKTGPVTTSSKNIKQINENYYCYSFFTKYFTKYFFYNCEFHLSKVFVQPKPTPPILSLPLGKHNSLSWSVTLP